MIRTWMRYLGCIFLDRENARSAMNSLREGTELLKKAIRSQSFQRAREAAVIRWGILKAEPLKWRKSKGAAHPCAHQRHL